MNRQTTKVVDEIGQLHIEGNIIPPQWFKAIRQGKRADTVAVIILGEVFYWYRPTVIRDEATGDVKEIRRKFDGDKWQCSYQSMADRFGLTKRQCQDAAKRLRDAGLITLELRNFVAPNGTHLSNVLFIEPVPAAIKRITFEIPSDVPAEGVLHSDVGGITPERKTYTEIPTETPTDKERGDSKIESPSPEEKEAEELYNAMPSQSAGMVPQEHTAATADPRIEKRQFVKEIAPICAEIMGRVEVILEDTRTAKKIFERHLPHDRVIERLDAYRNGEGAEFRKPGAVADWIVGKLQRDLAQRVMVENNDALIKARLMAA